MPELPEVETIVNYLAIHITGKKITKTKVWGARVLREERSQRRFINTLKNKKIISVSRQGKYILLNLSGSITLAIHLMMTGALLLNSPKNKHERMRINFKDSSWLSFQDIRQFGKCFLAGKKDITLGQDILKISRDDFSQIIKSSDAKIKSLLLNQKKVSGIGNIYADEILWRAGINPAKRAASISGKKVGKLLMASKEVLNKAIKEGGSSMRDYRKPDSSKGGYYRIRKVYDRENKMCSICGGTIKKVRISSRGTYFCPKHQL